MYGFCLAVQYVAIIGVIVGLMYLLQQWPSRSQFYMMFLGVAVLIFLLGYLFEITASSFEGALISTKISYVGKVYVPVIAFFFVLHYCRIKFSNWFVLVSAALHTAVLMLVLTCEYHDIFYTDLGFSKDGAFPHLEHWHGPGYVAYMALVLCYSLGAFCVCVYRLQKSRDKERKKVLCLMLMILFPAFGLVLYLSGITHGYDTTAIGYVISGCVLFFSIVRHDFFDTVNLAKDYVVENLSDGLVVFGNQGQLVYANAPALRLYPNLEKEEGVEEAIADIRSYNRAGELLCRDGRMYSISERNIYHKEALRGKMFFLRDVTDNYTYTTRLEEEVKKKTRELLKTQHSLIVSLANMVEARDGVTGLHIMYTSAYVEIIARALQKVPKYQYIMSDSYVSILSEAAPLHDIGKISIPDAILRKEGALTQEEHRIIQSHPRLGAQIIDGVLSDVESNAYLETAKEMASFHHERWDGSGYPYGLGGEEIPLSARIMSIADVYDALRAERSYKDACSKEEAKEIIVAQSGTHFDPELVEVFLGCIEEIEAVK